MENWSKGVSATPIPRSTPANVIKARLRRLPGFQPSRGFGNETKLPASGPEVPGLPRSSEIEEPCRKKQRPMHRR